MKQLKTILPQDVIRLEGNPEVEVRTLELDSRKVEHGGAFFAIPGTQVDGHDFIAAAEEKGASVIVCEQLPESCASDVVYVVVSSSSQALAWMAAAFYD